MSVIIVGATKGIGLYLWKELEKENFTVIPIGRTEMNGVIRGSIEDEDFYKKVINIERIKLIIFCASTLHPLGELLAAPLEDVKKSISINLIGPLAFLKGLRSRKVEGVVFLTSVLGKEPQMHFGSYSLAKVIINSLPNLLSSLPFCCAIDPGLCKTEMSEQFLALLGNKNNEDKKDIDVENIDDDNIKNKNNSNNRNSKKIILKELQKSDERLEALLGKIILILQGKGDCYNGKVVDAEG